MPIGVPKVPFRSPGAVSYTHLDVYKRQVVRGVVMNPVDHPHGGGEGKASIGRKRPTTPWGYPALGIRSRKRNKYSKNFIVHRRSK